AEQKNIELAEKQAQKAEAELLAHVVKPAEAEKRRLELDAAARKFQQVQKAEADAEAKKLDAAAEAEKLRLEGEAQAAIISAQGKAEADAIREKGLAEAEALERKAEALAKMDEAGKLQMVIEKLPEIARAVAEPLSKIGNITIIGGNGDGANGPTEVAGYAVGALKAVNEAMKETIGFDLTEVMKANTYDAKVNKNVTVELSGDVLN
ncbi:MAG: hypothetical protein K0S60_770, partial [Evtepia sp.]|nr:hypothetical protein [Evtepia sp.]